MGVWLTAGAGMLAAVAAVGWWFDWWVVLPADVPMPPVTAWLFLLLNAAIYALRRWPERPAARRLGWGISVSVGAVSLLVLVNLGRKHALPAMFWFWPDRAAAMVPSTMEGLTAIAFLLSALAVGAALAVPRHKVWGSVVSRLGALVFLIGGCVLLWYLSGAARLGGVGAGPMPVLAALEFVLVGWALRTLAGTADWLLQLLVGKPVDSPQGRRSLVWLVLGVVLAAGIGLGSAFYLQQQTELVRARTQDELDAIARMKAHQIASWWEERLADARLVAASPPFARSIADYLASPATSAARDAVARWLQALHQQGRYGRVLLLDTQPVVRLSVPAADDGLGPLAQAQIGEALQSGQVTVSDLHLSPVRTNYPHIDLIVPVALPGQPPVGVVLLEIDAAQSLFPLVQSWPTASPTAETLLVRREGNTVLFLNELRHRRDSALSLRLPLSAPELPAALALKQKTGVTEGRDYRGEPVLAAFRPVPGTPWTMVTKVDAAEIYHPLRQQVWLLILVLAAVATALYLSLGLWWEHRHAEMLRQQLRAERDRQALSQRLAYLLKCANDAIILNDAHGRILEANDRALEYYGYSLDELRQLPPGGLRPPAGQADFARFLEQVRTQGWALAETVHQRKDGSTFPVEVSTRRIELDGGTYLLAIIRDITARHRAEAALRESEEVFRALSRSSPLGVFMTSRDGRFEYTNPRCREIFGLTFGQSVGDGWKNAIHPDDRDRVAETWTAKIRAAQPVNLEFRVRQPGSARRWVHLRGDVRLAEDGTPQGYVGTVEDITARKQAETAIRDSEQRYRSLVETAPDVIFAVTPAGNIASLNPAFTKLTGRPVQEWVGRPFAPLVHPDDLPRAMAALQTILAGQPVAGLELRTANAAGDYLLGEYTITPQRAGDRIVGALGIARDITARKQAEETIKRLAAFPQSNPNPVLEFSAAGEILYCNAAATALARALGFAEPAAMLPLDTAAIVAECLKTNQSRTRLEFPCGPRIISWSFYPLADRGVVHCYAGDVTDRHQLEAQIRQSQKMQAVGQLAGGIAHDFNNLLNVIIGYGELALAKMDPASPFYKHVSEMKKAGERAAGLTRQLLAFSRKQIIEPKILDLNAVVSDLYQMLRRLVREDIEIVFRPAANLGRVKADPTQLEQVITNLVVNARDAMPQGGKLTIATGLATFDAAYAQTHPDVAPGHYVRLSIRDTGIGMTDEVKARLFEPFFTTKPLGQGTGLGLATCYGVIKQSGGHITVESKVGQGTVFHVYLPRIAEEAARKDGEESTAVLPVGRETILLVEDEEAVRQMAELMLTELGYTVLAAANGEEALRVAREKGSAIQLLVTDVVMPRLSGKQLADTLRQQHPTLKVLFVSGYTADAIAHDGVLDPGVAFLNKPFQSFMLARKIREVLDAP